MAERGQTSRLRSRERADWQDGDEPGPSAGMIGAGVVLVVIAVCGVVVGVNALRGGASATSGAADGPSVCGLAAGGAVSGVPLAEWRVDESSMMAAPYSKEIGPAEVGPSGVHQCFAPGEAGAVFAAAHFLLDSQAPAISNEALASRVVDDEFKAALVATFVERPQTPQAGELAGFQVVDYDDRRATVELVWRVTAGAAAGALGATPVDLTWVDGDWRVQGTSAEASTWQLDSMQGYTEWSAP